MSKTKQATKKSAVAPAAAPARNASQKIEALENAFMSQNQQMQVLADEIDKLRQLVVGLSKRINASIQAAEEGGLNTDSVNKIVLKENMKELEGKVKFLVDQGVLTKNNDAVVSDQTFVVGREVDNEGNVTNPRIQFAVGSIDKTLQEKLLSKKMGDMIKYSDTEPSLEIVEIYEISQPTVNQNYEAQQSAQ